MQMNIARTFPDGNDAKGEDWRHDQIISADEWSSG